jgi:hypothetical protein
MIIIPWNVALLLEYGLLHSLDDGIGSAWQANTSGEMKIITSNSRMQIS